MSDGQQEDTHIQLIFAAVRQRLVGPVRALCRSFGRESDYEDVLQDAILTVLDKVRCKDLTFKTEIEAAVYVLAVARTRLNALRRKGGAAQLSPELASNVAAVDKLPAPSQSEIEAAIEKLPPKLRAFAVACYPDWEQYQEPSIEAVKKTLGISLAGAYRRQIAVRKHLKRFLG